MPAVKDREGIRAAYSTGETAEQYVDRRFASAWGSVMHETQVKVLNRCISTWGVERLLEIAPGPGRLSVDVTGFREGYLCEANDSMLRVAGRRLREVRERNGTCPTSRRWHLVRGDAFALPLRGPFDMVYTFRFIRHFGDDDRAALYAQIHGLLRDGGLLVFDAVNVRVAWPARVKEGLDRHPIYDELYRRDALLEEVRANGFEVVSLTEVIRQMTLQQWVQVLVGPRSHGLAKRLIQLLEYVPGQPLEWVVLCRKIGHRGPSGGGP